MSSQRYPWIKKTLERVDHVAREAHISRSRLIPVAVNDCLQKQENQSFLAALNTAYSDQPTAEEAEMLQAMQSKYKSLLEEDPC